MSDLSQLSDQQFRIRLARHLYDMFEMRTNRNWEDVGGDNYPDMHKEWLECADELIERMSSDDPG